MTTPQKFIYLVAGLIAVVIVSACLGNQTYSPIRIWKIIQSDESLTHQTILLSFRFPRIALASVVGLTLAVSGVLIQSVLRNDLAAPGILGVSSGSNLGVTLTMIIGGSQITSPWMLPAMSMLCASLTVLLVCILAYHSNTLSPVRLLLTGVSVSLSIGALTLVLAMHLDRTAYAHSIAWMSGSLAKADWNYVFAIAGLVTVALPVAWSNRHLLDAMRFSDETANSLGVSVNAARVCTLLFAVLIASAAMSVVGSVAFVGLIAPHIGRRLTGPNHGPLIASASLVGAGLLVGSDTIGRAVFHPVEMPAGVIVSVVGGAYFLYLLVTHRS
ncbi:iron ABC transporter permease [Stieleria sp. JC731]|uniref:FecCD family ABC transporter permease n=1 Tax=Pirellulaceae TaxID=2691357 RepID=UPI001E5C6939|nr:iron ABC transporter permease [Stieleria sp. JC731]MCC9601299.1 iron ABC transporter permease [Stieleria sp. JC731]